MIVRHFFIPKIAHSSYMLLGRSSCAVIDPARDVEMYIEAAAEAGLRISHILQTHLHADFLSGHMDLAEATGAEIVVPASAGCAFHHMAVTEGDVILLDHMKIQVMETPGHTPEHVSYVVTDTSRGESPVGVFCGDTLFVGDAGRPDLFPGRAEELAGKLYESLSSLKELPYHCEIWPAHGAGSLCGRAVGAKYTSTIGYEKLYNPVLGMNRETLVASLTGNMPPAPDHFTRCSEMNRQGPKLLRGKPRPSALTPEEFRFHMDSPDVTVVDTRCCDGFAACHIPDSLNISIAGNFPVFAGWILKPGSRLLLVADAPEQAAYACRAASMVGEFDVAGFLTDGLFSWSLRGFPLSQFPLVLPGCLKRMLEEGADLQLVDTRGPGEFAGGTIPGAVNIPAPDLRTRHSELDRERDTLLFCSSGHRSSLAASILEVSGFRNLAVLNGGTSAWNSYDD